MLVVARFAWSLKFGDSVRAGLARVAGRRSRRAGPISKTPCLLLRLVVTLGTLGTS
jgi:hypothetical protein